MRGKHKRLKARRLSAQPLYEELHLDEPVFFATIVDTAPAPRKPRKSIWKRMKQNKAATLLLAAQVIPITVMVLYAAIFRTNW